MIALQTPTASAVRVSTLTVNMTGADGPTLQYSLDFGHEVDGVFTVAYSTSGLVDGANAIAFVQQFASIEPQFLQFLAGIGGVPPLVG
jgi:hypothetical protein